MRVLLFLAVLAVVGLVVTGAIKMQSTPDHKISIQIDKERVKEDIKEVVGEGKELFKSGKSRLQSKNDKNDNEDK